MDFSSSVGRYVDVYLVLVLSKDGEELSINSSPPEKKRLMK